MKTRIQLFAISFTLLFTTAVMAQNVGSVAPDFSLQTIENKNFKLSNQQDKVVMVFFFGYNCSSCRGIAPSVQSKLVNPYKNNQNFVAIGIDTWNGSVAAVESFKNSTGIDFDLLVQGSAVASSWNTTYDKIVVVNGNREIVFKGSGLVSSHINEAIQAVDDALDQLITSVPNVTIDQKAFNVYPNPITDNATILINVQTEGLLEFHLFDITGKNTLMIPKKHYDIGEHKIQFTRNALKNGIYFLKMKSVYTEEIQRIIIR